MNAGEQIRIRFNRGLFDKEERGVGYKKIISTSWRGSGPEEQLLMKTVTLTADFELRQGIHCELVEKPAFGRPWGISGIFNSDWDSHLG